jgi:hypothetical protein
MREIVELIDQTSWLREPHLFVDRDPNLRGAERLHAGESTVDVDPTVDS